MLKKCPLQFLVIDNSIGFLAALLLVIYYSTYNNFEVFFALWRDPLREKGSLIGPSFKTFGGLHRGIGKPFLGSSSMGHLKGTFEGPSLFLNIS